VPVLLAPGEPIRTHWAEILETAERLGVEQGSPSLVPTDGDDRMRPIVRHAFATASPDLSSATPPILALHRDRIYAKHLELPVRL
jgi:hypothetical protein